MAALCVQISDAIVSLIEGATLNQSFTVERQWVEDQQRENMKETDPAFIVVVPRTLNVSAFDLKPRNAYNWDIGIWIDKVVDTTTTDCDPIAEFMEQVVTLLATNRNFVIGPIHAQLVGIGPHPTYDATQLLDIRVFRSVFVATYRVIL